MRNSVQFFILIALALAISYAPSYAYVPPSHFIASKITQKKQSWNSVLITFSLLKLKKGKQQKQELLWNSFLVYHNMEKQSVATNKEMSAKKEEEEEEEEKQQKDSWPLLELFLEKNPTKLIKSWKNFQLDVAQEEELALFTTEEIKSLGEIPKPFYRIEENASYRRLQNKVVWSYESKDKSRALLIEKDSFLPLMIFGPCPDGSTKIQNVFTSGAATACFVKFAYNSQWRKFSIPKKSTLNINGRDILMLRIDSIIKNPKKAVIENILKKNKGNALPSLDIIKFFHKYFLRV